MKKLAAPLKSTNGHKPAIAPAARNEAARAYADWKRKFDAMTPRDRQRFFKTVSGATVPPLCTPLDTATLDYARDLGMPGEYPYTRGVRTNLYWGKPWTIRLFSGFATAPETNRRYKTLLEQGGTGLSVAFDMPTLMGRDSDDAQSEGEVGKCGVAIDTLKDMETLFNGIPLDKVTTSMTINSPAIILWAMYLAVGEKQGVPLGNLGGTIQNDILKEYIAQKEFIFPPAPSMRLITDILSFATRHVPKWNTISVSGYHIREAGSTAVQELAFTLADGFAYVEAGIKAGLDVDAFAPRLSFFFNSHLDFFEEVAKFRAARRIWARHMREKYKAKKPESWLLRFHTQTAGCSLTAQQPENNIVRTAYQALAAVMGGTQSLHTNSMDETLALPTEKAALIALRTQQVLMNEIGVTPLIDPLGGSYFVETMTNRMEQEAEGYFAEIERRGGLLQCIEEGYLQREIANAAFEYQTALEKKERIVVGVNEYVTDDGTEIPTLYIEERFEKEQAAVLKKVKATRDPLAVRHALEKLKAASKTKDKNLVPYVLDCVRTYATEGEIVNVWRETFGEYREPAVF